MAKKDIIAAIRRAGRELGRAPSRGELKRITGVSHYRVLTEFRSLREAVRAAGMRPNSKGERIETQELIKDWERVKKKLGRKPSRAEYVREGRYSAGAFCGEIRELVRNFNHRGHGETQRKKIGASEGRGIGSSENHGAQNIQPQKARRNAKGY